MGEVLLTKWGRTPQRNTDGAAAHRKGKKERQRSRGEQSARLPTTVGEGAVKHEKADLLDPHIEPR